ncbi:MAG: hypothetical protein AB7S92_05730 [Parvibaculaceae bacterium]
MTKRIGWRITALAIAAAVLAVFAAANAHLVYVAVRSQPDCVPHQKEAGGEYQAARSAC